jgi:uncharacterized protein (TIGR02145 family)
MNLIISFFRRNRFFRTFKSFLERLDPSARIYFGPKKFKVVSDQMTTESCALNNPDFEYFENNFTLGVQNGISLFTKVSKIEIRVDGVLVVSTRDFRFNRYVTKHLSTLSPSSVLEVKLKGHRGSFIRLGIAGVLCSDTITDIEGNYYHTVKICNQWWMAENLRTTKYNDGTDIPYGPLGNPGSYLWYNDDIGYKIPYGAMYDYLTVATNKLAPAGWHVPSLAEWETMKDCLTNNGYGYGGSGNDIGKALAATSYWDVSQTPGTIGNDQSSNNSSGFNALPGGDYNHSHPRFLGMGEAGFWCTSTKIAVDPYLVALHYNGSTLDHYYDSQPYHMSVRCVKD